VTRVCVAEQWLQFDIGPPTLVTGVVTKGRGDGRKKHWVTEYRLSYSNNSRLWHFYKDEPLQEIKARLLLTTSSINFGFTYYNIRGVRAIFTARCSSA